MLFCQKIGKIIDKYLSLANDLISRDMSEAFRMDRLQECIRVQGVRKGYLTSFLIKQDFQDSDFFIILNAFAKPFKTDRALRSGIDKIGVA